MPAFNAEQTLVKTYMGLNRDIIDEVIVVDDFSSDNTIETCKQLNVPIICHPRNMGYGANQKTCYAEALKRGAEIVIMVHPDYQYDPKLAPALAAMIASGTYDAVIGSRMLGTGALKGGMPFYKYIANRFLTFWQNILCGHRLSEYHSGYRAFSSNLLRTLPLEQNSDDFIFDNEMLGQIIYFGYRVGEISCPTKYFAKASSINFLASMKYGFGVLGVCLKFFLQRLGILKFAIFQREQARGK